MEKREDGLSFSREEILKGGVMSELWALDLDLFYLILISIILNLDKEYDVISHMTVIQSHNVVTQVTITSHKITWHRKRYRKFWNK